MHSTPKKNKINKINNAVARVLMLSCGIKLSEIIEKIRWSTSSRIASSLTKEYILFAVMKKLWDYNIVIS